jgi:hypothetical protein
MLYEKPDLDHIIALLCRMVSLGKEQCLSDLENKIKELQDDMEFIKATSIEDSHIVYKVVCKQYEDYLKGIKSSPNLIVLKRRRIK